MHAWPEGLGFSKSVECTTGIISVCDPSVLWLSTDVSSPNVTPRATNAFITPLIHNSYAQKHLRARNINNIFSIIDPKIEIKNSNF
jgi:hypothetical protein